MRSNSNIDESLYNNEPTKQLYENTNDLDQKNFFTLNRPDHIEALLQKILQSQFYSDQLSLQVSPSKYKIKVQISIPNPNGNGSE